MRNLMKSRFTLIAVVAVLLASVNQAGAVELPTISIIDSDTAPITVTITGFPANILFFPASFPEGVTITSSSAPLSDFGPIGLVLTDGGGISDVLTVVVTDGILTVQFDSDTGTGTLTAPPGYTQVPESANPSILTVSIPSFPQFQVSVLSDPDPTTVAEPATLILVAAGTLASAGVRFRRRRLS
jgi:hypothetical protein